MGLMDLETMPLVGVFRFSSVLITIARAEAKGLIPFFYFNFTAKFLLFIQPFIHSVFRSAFGRLEARFAVLVRVLVHPRTEVGVRGFGLVRRHRCRDVMTRPHP